MASSQALPECPTRSAPQIPHPCNNLVRPTGEIRQQSAVETVAAAFHLRESDPQAHYRRRSGQALHGHSGMHQCHDLCHDRTATHLATAARARRRLKEGLECLLGRRPSPRRGGLAVPSCRCASPQRSDFRSAPFGSHLSCRPCTARRCQSSKFLIFEEPWSCYVRAGSEPPLSSNRRMKSCESYRQRTAAAFAAILASSGKRRIQLEGSHPDLVCTGFVEASQTVHKEQWSRACKPV
mmetsp:Transcript_57714/g.135222  ORF Transcript_57714/g.135222 Transcript_57714/m.135222 type:complete len:238 (-) Transcript_57714:1096-1809(-)